MNNSRLLRQDWRHLWLDLGFVNVCGKFGEIYGKIKDLCGKFGEICGKIEDICVLQTFRRTNKVSYS